MHSNTIVFNYFETLTSQLHQWTAYPDKKSVTKHSFKGHIRPYGLDIYITVHPKQQNTHFSQVQMEQSPG